MRRHCSVCLILSQRLRRDMCNSCYQKNYYRTVLKNKLDSERILKKLKEKSLNDSKQTKKKPVKIKIQPKTVYFDWP